MDHNSESRRQLDIMQMLVEMSCGQATDEQYAQLDELVCEDESAREFVITGLTHLADFEWENRVKAPPVLPPDSDLLPLDDHSAPGPAQEMHRLRSPDNRPEVNSQAIHQRAFVSWAGICASFLLGASATLWFVYQLSGVFRPEADFSLVDAHETTFAVATLVSNTSYMWDAKEGTAMEAGALIQAGQSVALFGGIAEVEFESGVTTRIQGPAILSFNASGVPDLKYGKFITSNMSDEVFEMDIPMASSLVTQGSRIGIDAFGGEVVVHALGGRTTLVPTAGSWGQITVLSGEAVRLLTNARSELGVYNSVANPDAFDFDMLLGADQIDITPEYVALIKEAGPVAYWRFEDKDSDVIRNEIQQRHDLHLLGNKVQISNREGNGHAEFIIRESSGCFVSYDNLDELAGQDYSVEFWFKPSHYHRGAIVSLVEQSNDELGNIERHGLIVEIQSANPILRPEEGQPRTVRFHHRSPPHEGLVGTSCSSPETYQKQVWQHVVAVKDKDTMRLFLDGEIVASEFDDTYLPNNLSLVVGQLFSFGTVRPFVGQLDELAIYNRALSAEEIKQRVMLVRPANHEANL